MTTDDPVRTRCTVLELRRLPSGEWRATQAGADDEGRGHTAAAAAAEYCRRVEERLRERPPGSDEGAGSDP